MAGGDYLARAARKSKKETSSVLLFSKNTLHTTRGKVKNPATMKIIGIDCHVLLVPDVRTGATDSAQVRKKQVLFVLADVGVQRCGCRIEARARKRLCHGKSSSAVTTAYRTFSLTRMHANGAWCVLGAWRTMV